MAIKLTNNDKKLFKTEIKKLNPVEILAVAKFVEESPLSSVDKKFCETHIGIRCEKLLKNIAKKQSFLD